MSKEKCHKVEIVSYIKNPEGVLVQTSGLDRNANQFNVRIPKLLHSVHGAKIIKEEISTFEFTDIVKAESFKLIIEQSIRLGKCLQVLESESNDLLVLC